MHYNLNILFAIYVTLILLKLLVNSYPFKFFMKQISLHKVIKKKHNNILVKIN